MRVNMKADLPFSMDDIQHIRDEHMDIFSSGVQRAYKKGLIEGVVVTIVGGVVTGVGIILAKKLRKRKLKKLKEEES